MRVARTPGSVRLDRWAHAVAIGGARGSRWRRSTCRALRCRPTCAARAGPRRPCSWPPSRPVARRAPDPTGPSRCGRRAGAAATATVGGDGTVSVSVAAGEPLDEVVLRSYAVGRRAPGARVGAQRGRGRGRGRRRARPHHPVLRDHPGPRHARGGGRGGGRSPARRWRRAIPSSLPSPPRRGWQPGSLRRGPWTEEVAREHSGRALLTGGAGRPVARVLGTDRRRAGPRRSRARGGGLRGPGPQGLGQPVGVVVGTRRSAGRMW